MELCSGAGKGAKTGGRVAVIGDGADAGIEATGDVVVDGSGDGVTEAGLGATTGGDGAAGQSL